MEQEAVTFSDVRVSQTFTLTVGGRYRMVVSGDFASNDGTIELFQVAGDGNNVPLLTSFNNANTEADLVGGLFTQAGSKVFDLPPGQYFINVDGLLDAYIVIARVPLA